MASELSIRAQEGSTFVIKADFVEKNSDEGDEVLVTPNIGLTWSLTDVHGNPINNRIDVPLTPAESVNIVLSGDDLALNSPYPARRYVTVKGTYNSTLGSNLPLKSEVSFQIENLVAVPWL